MAKQGRTQGGKFAPKSNEPRSVRTVRLTDSAWTKLGEIAGSRGITRADLLEEQIKCFPIDQIGQLNLFDDRPAETGSSQGVNLQQVEAAIAQTIDDPQVTRKGKDRGSVKRALEALLKRLY